MEAAPDEALRGELRLLANLLLVFALIKIVACSLVYTSAVAAGGGNDVSGAQTLFWMPQILFYSLFAASSWRLRRLDGRSRTAVVTLSIVSIVATVLYTLLDFTVGPGSQQPAMALAIKLRLLAGGDVWDVVFPVLAILRLRPEAARRLCGEA
jgi:hypothetical protein